MIADIARHVEYIFGMFEDNFVAIVYTASRLDSADVIIESSISMSKRTKYTTTNDIGKHAHFPEKRLSSAATNVPNYAARKSIKSHSICALEGQ